MKKGKKIWNRLLSLLLCLVMVVGIFAGMGIEAEAATIPGSEEQANNGGNIGYDHIWVLTPGSTGTQFYDKVSGLRAGNYAVLKELTYITTSQYGLDSDKGFFWQTDCKDKEFTDGEYWVYIFSDSYNGTKYVRVRYEHKVTVRVRYSIDVSVSGASGGGITVNNNDYSGGEISEGSSLTFGVKNVTDYTPTVTFGGTTLSGSNGTYTISSDDIANASDRTIRVNYELTNKSEITINNPGNVTIRFNNNTDTLQTVGKSRSYTISARAYNGYSVTDILVDGQSVCSGNNTTLTLNWQPTANSHTISANVVKKEIKAKNGTINLRDEMTAQETAEAIFNAIHDWNNVNLTVGHLDTEVSGNDKYSCIQYSVGENWISYMKITNSYWDFVMDNREYFKNLTESTAQVRIFSNEIEDSEYASNAVTLTINKMHVEAKRPLTKVYDGNPMTLSTATAGNPDFKWSGNEGNIVSLSIVGHYDSEKNLLSNAPTAAGNYFVKVKATDSLGSNTSDFIPYEIVKQQIQETDVTVSITGDYTYNGNPQEPLIIVEHNDETLSEGVDYTLEYDNTNGGQGNNTNAGEVTVHVNFIGNYSGSATSKFVIKKAAAQVTEIEDPTKTYDKSAPIVEYTTNNTDTDKSVIIEYKKQSEDDSAYTNVAPTDVGDYVVRVSIAESANYYAAPAVERDFSINQRKLGISGLTIEKTYDGKPKAELSNIIGTETLTNVIDTDAEAVQLIRANAEITLDSKDVTAQKATVTGLTLEGERAFNYCLPETVEFKAEVKERELTADITVNDKQYNGLDNAVISGATLNNVVDGENVGISYGDVTAAFAGVDVAENITVNFTGNFELTGEPKILQNYKLVQPESAVADIYNNYEAVQGIDYTVNSNGWINTDFIVTANADYELSRQNRADAANWSSTLTETGDIKEGKTYFYVRNTETGAISKTVEEIYNIDKTAPAGEITVAENKFYTFLNEITFGTFFNKTQTVTIAATDSLSGVAKIEYYESAEGLTEEQIVNLPADAWTEGNRVSVTLEDAKRFVYYARITDNAGNQLCISSDGNVYDITPPEITGISNGETYYTTQVANASDTNLSEVTLNSSSFTVTDGKIDPITLEGNKDATYIIVATDKAGNETIVSITMKPLTDLAEDITDDNIALEDEAELEKSEEILKEALKEENLSKLTPEEDEAIREKLSEIQGLLQNIDEVQNVIDLLESLPSAYKKDGETVNPYVSDRMDDEEQNLYSAVKAAYKAYNKLSAHQQSLISTGLKHNLSNLRKVLTDYRITDGDGKVWVYDTNGTITFTANGPVCRFENALIDGKKVPAEEMKVTKGSTVVEVDAGYLYRLGLGDHTFQMEYTDGSTDVAEFSIVTIEEWNAMMNQSGTNQTGTGAATSDSANILLWGAALAVGAAGMVVAKKRRKDEEA